jgi:hypothetical protein
MEDDIEIDPEVLEFDLDGDCEYNDNNNDTVNIPDLFEETDNITRAYNILKDYADANSLPILQNLTPARFYSYFHKD